MCCDDINSHMAVYVFVDTVWVDIHHRKLNVNYFSAGHKIENLTFTQTYRRKILKANNRNF